MSQAWPIMAPVSKPLSGGLGVLAGTINRVCPFPAGPLIWQEVMRARRMKQRMEREPQQHPEPAVPKASSPGTIRLVGCWVHCVNQ